MTNKDKEEFERLIPAIDRLIKSIAPKQKWLMPLSSPKYLLGVGVGVGRVVYSTLRI